MGLPFFPVDETCPAAAHLPRLPHDGRRHRVLDPGESRVQGAAPRGHEVPPFAGTEVFFDDGKNNPEKTGRDEALRFCYR